MHLYDRSGLSRPPKSLPAGPRCRVCRATLATMSSLLEQVVDDLRSLSREEQDRVAEVVLAFLDGSQDDFRLMA
jgi:hypothetical protein